MKAIFVLIGAIGILPAAADIIMTKTAPAENALFNQDLRPVQEPPTPSPWRIVNGTLTKVNEQWVTISGTVEQVHPHAGIRVSGWINGVPSEQDFFVTNFPIALAEKDSLPTSFACKVFPVGVYEYTTAAGSTRTIHKFDYGLPAEAPRKSAAQIAADKKVEIARREAAKLAALKMNQDQAAQGDAYGQFRMGERYRDGDGVETNLLKAKILFTQAADQGNPAAAKALAALTNRPTIKQKTEAAE